MFEALFSLKGRLDRQPFMRASVVIAGLCLMSLVVLAHGGVGPIANTLGWPIDATNRGTDLLTVSVGIVVVIGLPAPIILKRLRDLRLPSLLGFAAIGLIEAATAAIMTQTENHLAGAFAALAVLCASLVLLCVAPSPEERADTALALVEEDYVRLVTDDWTLLNGQPERRTDAYTSNADRLIDQLAAQDAIRIETPKRPYPNFAAGEGFGRRRGDRR
jgi:uncharacterized membrane protein YhaH (DUF805 family)